METMILPPRPHTFLTYQGYETESSHVHIGGDFYEIQSHNFEVIRNDDDGVIILSHLHVIVHDGWSESRGDYDEMIRLEFQGDEWSESLTEEDRRNLCGVLRSWCEHKDITFSEMCAVFIGHREIVPIGSTPELVEVEVDHLWDDELQQKSTREGWDVFCADGIRYDIERIDCPDEVQDDEGTPIGGVPHLSGDAAAIDLCLRKALDGSSRHLLALMMEQMPAGKKLYLPQWFLDQAKDL